MGNLSRLTINPSVVTDLRLALQQLSHVARVAEAMIQLIDKSTNSSIERPARRGESLSEALTLRASALGLLTIRSNSCIPAAFRPRE